MKGAAIVLGILSLLLAGCASTRVEAPSSTGTQVELSRHNYRIVKANAIGVSNGFKLLGIIPLANPSYAQAMTRLYASAGPTEGRSVAVINLAQERTGLYLILFSLPKLTVRADIIEWQDEKPAANQGQ